MSEQGYVSASGAHAATHPPTDPSPAWPHRVEYQVTREAIKAFCAAIGEQHPLCTDLSHAQAAGYRDLVAPPMFAAVYALAAIEAVQDDPATDFDYERAVHGAQEFRWDPRRPVLAGDTVVSDGRLSEVHRRGALRFFMMLSRSRLPTGESLCDGVWTAIVRDPPGAVDA
ncbi:MAG: MaoC family dehydratase [Solirubrobacterales bacterium]|nr:MaoC family dehydratase [Solirubrobacterales bacterium]MCW3025479.1 MaoC family dehydratase [Solirubrobacterales bacterium]